MGMMDVAEPPVEETHDHHQRYIEAGDGDWPQRLLIAAGWVRAEPAAAQGWYFLGEAHRSLGENAAALDAFTAADRLRGNDIPTIGRMAELHLVLNDAAQSRRHYRRLLSLAGTAPFWAHVGLANASQRLGDFEDALLNFLRAAASGDGGSQLGPRIVECYETLGAAEKKKHASEVLPFLRLLAEREGDSDTRRLQYDMAVARSMLGERLQDSEARFFRLDGFVSEDEIGGWYSDARDPAMVRTIEAIEAGNVVSEAPNDLAFALGASGGFRLRIPGELLDGSIHDLVFRVRDAQFEFERIRYVTPRRGAALVRSASLDAAEWLVDLPVRKILAGKERPARTASGKQEEATSLLPMQLLETVPGAARDNLVLRLADLLRKANRGEEALEVTRQAIALDGKNAMLVVSHAQALAAAGRELEGERFLADALERLPGEASLIDLSRQFGARRRMKRAELIAFYLPQFHITAENNQWWGRGFTEWTNVGTARPLFDGHVQPRRPTALGYYDLRVPEAVNAQFDLARRYGIAAFCYYYYWFDGRKILDRPLQDLLDGRTGPFPFCICWANEDWTRSWDGMTGEVLLAQNHSADSDRRFILDVIPILRHPGYYRYQGKPLVMVYRAEKLTGRLETVAEWRQLCRDAGIGEIHLCAAQSFGLDDPSDYGFDAAVEFPPHSAWSKHRQFNYYSELPDLPNLVPRFSGKVYDYAAFADAAMKRPAEPYTLHRSCMMAWDNTPRRGKTAHVYHNFSTRKFRDWLVTSAGRAAADDECGLVFINAWNEWAEGTTLEPDNVYGFEHLEAARQAQKLVAYAANRTYWRHGEPQFPGSRIEAETRVILVGHDAIFNGAQINLLNMARCLKRDLGVDVAIYLIEGGPLLSDYERLGPTTVLGREEGWKQTFLDSLSRHRAAGTGFAICNTVVTGETVGVLREAGFKTASLVHEMPSLIESYGLQHVCWKVADHADWIVFASPVVAEQFQCRYWPKEEKILIAPQGIVRNAYVSRRGEMRQELRRELGLADAAMLVVGCGYGDTRKGIDLFVQMAAEVRRLMKDKAVFFIWVGALEAALETYIRADIRRLDLESDLVITGTVSDPARYFMAGDVFALTSREDPFPSVVMEAFEAFMPVIAFDGGGGYVEIVGEDTGGLVTYLDVAAMAARIYRLLDNDELRGRIGQHCHQFSRERFGYPPYMRKLLALYGGVSPDLVARGALHPLVWDADKPAPRISVIVPNYNYGRHLELRLRTILDQTLAPAEIIILDDASTDYSLELIEAVARQSDIPIRIVRNETNSGNPFVQWARGLDMASGELIWIAEADDYCEPTLLERLAREMTDESVVLAWADSYMVDEAGASSGYQYKTYHEKLHGDEWHHSFRTSGRRLNRRALLHNNVIPNASAALFRRSAIPADLAHIQEYRFSGDWWFWIELSEKGNVAYVADPLNYHRRHGRSVMGEVLREGSKLLPEMMSFFQRLIRHRPERITPAVALAILGRLNDVYALFPDLAGAAARPADHPVLGPQYRALVDTLQPARARARLLLKTPATLVVSADALEDAAGARQLLDTLRYHHRLDLVLLGENAAALGSPGLYGSVVWIAPQATRRTAARDSAAAPDGSLRPTRVPDAELPAAIARILAKNVPEKLYVTGLRAIAAMAQAPVPDGMEWDIVAGQDFDQLQGKASPRHVTAALLRRSIGRCTALRYLGAQVPHAAGRMAQAAFVPIERMEAERSGPVAERGSGHSGPIRLLALACSAPIEEWRKLAQVFAAASGTARPIVLRLLAWGDLGGRLRREFAGDPAVDVVELFEENAEFQALGDAGIDWGTGDAYSANRCWLAFARSGLKVILRSDGGEGEAELVGLDITRVESADEIAPALALMLG